MPMTRFIVSVVMAAVCITAVTADFDPYEMNGGLVAAVAGRDWTVLCADTRCSSGYNILQRNHVSSRLWVASSAAVGADTDDDDDSISSWISADGSIAMESTTTKPVTDWNSQPSESVDQDSHVSTSLLKEAPVMIASAGCQADCEALKRLVRADLRAARYFGEGGAATTSPDAVATLLSQMLYSRRGFPFYSFCVVAGLGESAASAGQVFVYDAVGSYEQVAVASAGTGRELLQPILDRQFRTLLKAEPTADATRSSRQSKNGLIVQTPPGAIPSVTVDCTKEEAVSILADAYRSVSEREIGVGDQVVFCVLQRKADGKVECQIIRYPLKQH
jgi:20S proteasome subunit beta 6